MEEVITKKEIVKKTVDKLKDKRIVVGGNKQFYKSEYHLHYSREIVNNVLSAFLQVMTDEIAEGNTIKLKDYFLFTTKYKEARRGRNVSTGESIDIPAKYVLKIKIFSQFKRACEKLTEKVLGGEEDNQ